MTPEVTLEGEGRTKAGAEITVEVWAEGSAGYTDITVAGETRRAVVTEGYAKAVFYLETVHLWDGMDDPYLYTAKAELEGGDVVETYFGCRSFRIDSQKGFFLNGRPYPLRGSAAIRTVQGREMP